MIIMAPLKLRVVIIGLEWEWYVMVGIMDYGRGSQITQTPLDGFIIANLTSIGIGSWKINKEKWMKYIYINGNVGYGSEKFDPRFWIFSLCRLALYEKKAG